MKLLTSQDRVAFDAEVLKAETAAGRPSITTGIVYPTGERVDVYTAREADPVCLADGKTFAYPVADSALPVAKCSVVDAKSVSLKDATVIKAAVEVEVEAAPAEIAPVDAGAVDMKPERVR